MSAHLDLSSQSGAAEVDFQETGGVINATYRIGGGTATNVADVGSATGTAFDDAFLFSLGLGTSFHLSSLAGGTGSDTLTVNGRAAIDVTGVSGVERYVFNNTGTVVLTDANFLDVAGPLSVSLSNGTLVGGLALDASALGASHALRVEAYLTSYIPISGGAGDDVFSGNFLDGGGAVLHGGAGHDTVVFSTAASFTAQTLAQIDGVEFFQLANAGINSVVVRAANFVGVTGDTIGVGLGQRGGTIDASGLDASQHVYLVGSEQNDMLKGGAADDIFEFHDDVQVGDVVLGGAGHDILLFLDDGGVDATGVSGVEFYLFGGAANSVAIRDSSFAGVAGPIGISGGMGLSVDGQSLSAGHDLFLIGTLLADDFAGGGGDDVLQFTAATLNASDIVRGGAGRDLLLLETAGVIDVGGVEGVEFYRLASGGANSLILSDDNLAGVTGVFGVQAGGGGDTLDASATTGVQIYLFGGAGVDTLKAGAGGAVLVTGGGADILTGGAGEDLFAFDGAAGATVNGFVSGVDRLFFSDAAFDLGIDEGRGAGVGFDRLDASLLSPLTDGGFTSTAQRFAFDAATGRLFYADQGSATAVGDIDVVATLTGVSALHAGDLFLGA